MKRCITCNILYGDDYNFCVLCGSRLVLAGSEKAPRESGRSARVSRGT